MTEQFDPIEELGKTGLNEHSGIVQEDFLREMRGKQGYDKFNEMRLNSPVVSALLTAIEQSVRSVEWQIGSDEEDDERVEFIQENLDNMTFGMDDHISEVLTMLPFGYSIFETVFKRDGSRIMWRKFGFRKQNTVYRWLMDDDGGIAGFVQQTGRGESVEIPIEKLILYRTRVEANNPEGRSILRPSYIPYYFLKNIQQIEAVGIERDLAGLPVVGLPEGASVTGTESDAATAAKIVRNIRNDEQAGVVLSHGWELTLLSTGGSRMFDTNQVINRYKKDILMTVLGQFLMLGMDGKGSLALSKDQTDFFNMAVNGFAKIIAETFSKFAIPKLLTLNGFDPEGIRIEHTAAGDVNADSLLQIFLSYAQAGLVIITPEDEVWIRGLLGAPEKTVEQIEEAQEEEKAELEERMARMTPMNNEEEDEDKMDVFAADPKDKRKRKIHENRWRKKIGSFFVKQGNRIVKEANDSK
jgi:hypothetical protein